MVKKNVGLLLILVLLIVHLSVLNDYGFTWDFHFHFFGAGKLLGYQWQQLEPRILPYVEPDPRNATSLPYGPLMSIPPFVSWLMLHRNLNVLPADVAYHLPVVLWGIGAVAILYAFLKEAVSERSAMLAAIFLSLTPRYFADLHNNMKDVPMAAVFTGNIWLLWRLVRYRRPKDLVFAVLAFAIAFNIKVNSIFIPLIFACWLLVIITMRKRAGSIAFLKNARPCFLYFLLAPLAALLVWSLFWSDPIGQIKHAWLTFGVGTNNIEVLLNGRWYCSGLNVPWYYPLWYLAIVTPLPILLFFLIGLGTSIVLIAHRSSFSVKKNQQPTMDYERSTKLLLVLWLFLPLTRYLIPTVGVIDGIRHFEEVLFPIAALAALGLDKVLSWFSNNITIRQYNPSMTLRASNAWKNGIARTLTIGVLGWLVWNIVSYHPFQIAYYNELVGGIRGAFGRYDLDYWGSSQKQAVAWLNQHLPARSVVHIVMAADIAGTYLRPDLLEKLNTTRMEKADYVVVLNRQSFYYRYHWLFSYLATHKPIQTIENQGVPLVWIFDNRLPPTPPQPPWWQGEDPCIVKYW